MGDRPAPYRKWEEMSAKLVIEVGDAIRMECPAPTCTNVHEFAVKSIDGQEYEFVAEDYPQYSWGCVRRGDKFEIERGRQNPILEVIPSGGTDILARHKAYEEILADIITHRYDELGFDLACEQYQDQMSDVYALLRDPRIKLTTDVAYGLCRLAGIEPTEELVLLIAVLLIMAPSVELTLSVGLHDFGSISEN